MFHVVPERAHDLSRWRLFVAQEVKVSGVLDEIIIVCYLTSTITLVSPWGWSGEKKHRHMREQLLSFASSDLAQAWELGCMRMG